MRPGREINGMSAFFLPKTHIDLLVSAAVEWKLWAARPDAGGGLGETGAEHADAIGRMLWKENAASVRHRYQSCEHANWRLCEARDFTMRLMAEAAQRLAMATLGDDYPWFAADPMRNDNEDVARRWATKAET